MKIAYLQHSCTHPTLPMLNMLSHTWIRFFFFKKENTIRRNDCPAILSQGSSTAQVLKIFKSLLNDTDYNS